MAGFVLISVIVVTALHRILISAVRVAPSRPDRVEAWSTSKDRALSLAKVRSDTQALILIYLVSGAGLVFPATLAVMVIGIGMATAPVQTLLTTYGAPLLSLVTFGAVSYALSAAKEVAVMRVEVEHRDREPTS
ncbi:MAG: hypothetical protein INR63_11530 [Actinomycetospora chiangmaiensis]|nr:hypothetical protein [Actinomycetospora chiangmaiensis]